MLLKSESYSESNSKGRSDDRGLNSLDYHINAQKHSVTVKEAQLDIDIDIIVKSILDTEQKLKDLIE